MMNDSRYSPNENFGEFLKNKASTLPIEEPILLMGKEDELDSNIFSCRGYTHINSWAVNDAPPDASRLNFPDNKDDAYGCIVMRGMLGKFDDPHLALREIKRVLKPGGLLIMSSPLLTDIGQTEDEIFRFTPSGLNLLLEKYLEDVLIFKVGEKSRLLSIFCTARKSGPLPSVTEPIDIVMLTFNRLKYLQQTVDTLYENTTYPFRLTIVDNASKADVRHYLENNRKNFFQLIMNEKNEYVPAFDIGIAKTSSSIFIATEPDIIVPKLSQCWLTQYIDIFKENPMLGLLGMRLDPKDRSPMTPSWAGGVDHATVYNKKVLLGNTGVWMMAMRRKVYPGSFFSDTSVCNAVRKKGYVVGYTKDIMGRHLGWYEYRDYPEYLLEKSRRPHPCFPVYEEAKLVDLIKLDKKKKPTIITTTFDGRLTWLKDLLLAIKTLTTHSFEMIVVDNGTTDGTREFLNSLDWVKTIRNEKNLDDTVGVNQALKIDRSEYFVKVDTDTLIADLDWWEPIYQYMEANPEVGIAGDIWNPGFEVQSQLFKEGWTPKKHGIDRLAHAQGGFMVLRKKMLDEIAFFNESFPHDGMDVEMSYRALSYGWKLGHLDFVKAQIVSEAQYSPKFKVYHPVRNSPLRQRIMKRIQEMSLTDKKVKGEVLLAQNGSWLPHVKPRGNYQISSNTIFISGSGWDNCLVSKQAYKDLVFSVGIENLHGSVILKVRLQNKSDPSGNSYHIILGDWGNYVAKANHVFKRLMPSTENPLQIKIAAVDSTIRIFMRDSLIAHFHDSDLKHGHVAFGVKDGQAKFINPKIEYF